MKYDLCTACQFFQPSLLTEEKHIKKSCNNPLFHDLFSDAVGGFPSGIDIIHCDGFTMHSPYYGDVFINDGKGHGISYILRQPRRILETRVGQLYDNSQNIRLINLNSK